MKNAHAQWNKFIDKIGDWAVFKINDTVGNKVLYRRFIYLNNKQTASPLFVFLNTVSQREEFSKSHDIPGTRGDDCLLGEPCPLFCLDILLDPPLATPDFMAMGLTDSGI